MGYYSRISGTFEKAPAVSLTGDSKYVLFSDCHRGTGSSTDNFLKNQNLYFAALQHYYAAGYSYIELGDGDELWENRNLEQIVEIHSNVFWLLSLFYQENRLYLLYGNHDMCKKNGRCRCRHLAEYFNTDTQQKEPLFPNMPVYESLILETAAPQSSLYLTHGHQADLLNSALWPLARFLVRYLWSPLEKFGVSDPTSAAKNYNKKSKVEKRLNHWAVKENHLLITGHTHRPRLSNDSRYFNTGSCVHPRCATCIEIENFALSLVKWTTATRDDGTLFVGRELLSGPFKLKDLR